MEGATKTVDGTIAITDFTWYDTLRQLPDLEEVNFWKPSAARAFHGAEFSPFLFKLRAPHNAICGLAFFARYAPLPDWLAWESFGAGNGAATFRELQERIRTIRERIRFVGDPRSAEIGCILLVQPVFFQPVDWVSAPSDWPVRTQSHIRYDLETGEGARIWRECLARQSESVFYRRNGVSSVDESAAPRFGKPQIMHPRLGQGTFRIAVTEAYGRSCAVTGEHSLPALEAAHIRPYTEEGPHLTANGLLLRADCHRLFDQGYMTITTDLRLQVGSRLRDDYANGRSYYPFQGRPIAVPKNPAERPSREFLEWHRANRYLG